MRLLLRTVSPWGPAESVRLAALVAVGSGAMVAAWLVVAGRDEWGSQIGWANVSVAGAVAVLYGVVSWLLRARTALLARRAVLLPDVLTAAVPAILMPSTLADEAGAWVADPAGGRFHRPSCPAATGRDWPTVAPESITGRQPCGICRP